MARTVTTRKGEGNGRARLSDGDAKAIKKSKLGVHQLVARYGVGEWTIRAIKRGERWGHIK